MAEFYREEVLQATLVQLSGVRAELNTIRQKVIIQLFGSSFAILFWVGSAFLGKVYASATLTLLLVILLTVNATMWACWLLFRALSFRPSLLHFPREESSPSQGDMHSLFMEYEALRFGLMRERRIE